MKISFVVPAYNEEAWLGDCLRSIITEVERSGAEAEIIVVNNASSDRTRQVALTFPNVVVVDESRKGLVFARSAGFAASTGDLIVHLDADSRLTPGWINAALRELGRDSALVAVTGPCHYFDAPKTTQAAVRVFYVGAYAVYLFNRFVLRAGSMLQGSNAAIRREALNAIGGYDTTIDFYGEDTDLARRLHTVGKVKWTFSLLVHTSGRRLKDEGLFKVGARYALNYFWTMFLGRPYSQEYGDVRPALVRQKPAPRQIT